MLALVPASAAANTESRIIVKREPGLSAAERRDIRADAAVRYVDSLSLPRTEVVAAAPGDVGDAVRELNADSDVVYAQPARPRRPAATDPILPFLWAFENTGQSVNHTRGIVDADMDVIEAWAASTGAGQTVAVVDTGVDRTHPDLAGQVFGGYDFLDEDNDPTDPEGHGTQVAGTIAAARDNGTGVAGVAPDSIVVPLRALGPGATDIETAEAFDWAGDHGVRIVNASLSGDDPSTAERDAMLSHPETLYVVAAGNGGDDGMGDDIDNGGAAYPCAYDLDNVICVGASDQNDDPADFSNYGETSVDLFAPGVNIISTEQGDYFVSDGTSMATPHVTGAAALVLARNPALSAAEVSTALLDYAEPKSELTGKSVTGARANANDSLFAVTEDPTAMSPFISDIDEDGVADASDNCAGDANAGQADGNGNGVGDVCDDRDNDGKVDVSDNCAAVPNAGQANLDGDALGDACDPDLDGDNVANGPDNCDTVANNQSDLDGDGAGDACDTTPRGFDGDADGKAQVDDACPLEYAITNDGCPLPQITSLSGKVRKRGTKRSVTVKIGTTRLANLRVKVERKKSGRWIRVASVTRITVANRAIVKASRLKRGRYRVRVAISNGAGNGAPVTQGFRVR